MAAAGEAAATAVAAPDAAAPVTWVAAAWTVGCEGEAGAAPEQAVSASNAGTAIAVEQSQRTRARRLAGLS